MTTVLKKPKYAQLNRLIRVGDNVKFRNRGWTVEALDGGASDTVTVRTTMIVDGVLKSVTEDVPFVMLKFERSQRNDG